jgi:hypothetical protein
MGCDSNDMDTYNAPKSLCGEDLIPILEKSLELKQGKKNDTGKLRYDLIPPGPLAELAKVYTIGANKYNDRNWEKGIKWGRIFAAMMRHAWAYWRGERDDPQDGQHHLASVAWCAFAIMEFEKTHPELDDRK